MPLTHVCMWKDKSFKRITVSEASSLYPYTVSANSGIFMCELCGQYVSFTKQGWNARHFKHTSGEQNKNCEDRSNVSSYSGLFQAEQHNLPLKIIIHSQSNFSFEIGFMKLPNSIMKSIYKHSLIIEGAELFKYSFERLRHNAITYFSVGAKITSKYKIYIAPSIDNIGTYWPSEIAGISKNGALFDAETGKKLPYDADVQIGHDYYLLTPKGIMRNTRCIEYIKICSQSDGYKTWRVYKVKVKEYCKDATRFLLEYHCRLTDEPVEIYPIWPVHTISPYVVYHKSKNINLFFQGNAEPKLAPYGYVKKYPQIHPKLLKIFSVDRQQLLSVGRTDVLRYMYFWESNLDRKGSIRKAKIVDIEGNVIEDGINNTLPKKNILGITPEVDGYLFVYYKDFLVEKYKLHSEQYFEYDKLRYGINIKVLQGLDCVWSTYFQESIKISTEDVELLKKLDSLKGKKIKVSHSISTIASHFDEDSFVRKWIYKTINKGVISENALKYLTNYIAK